MFTQIKCTINKLEGFLKNLNHNGHWKNKTALPKMALALSRL